MPPEDSAAADVAAPVTLDALPLALSLHILASLPADARLLAAAVCRSWRALLAEPALWTRLDLSSEGGVASPRSNALLRAAAARAGGRLEALRVSLGYKEPHDELLAVLAANAGTMRELALCTADAYDPPLAETVAALLRAAPGLRLLETGVFCEGAEALPVLRREPPFGPLRLKRFGFDNFVATDWRALADGLAAHSSVGKVDLGYVWPETQAESDALVGTLLSLPLLRTLIVSPPTSVLTRLLGCPALTSLHVCGCGVPLLGSPASAALLCDALRANTQIEALRLYQVALWRDMDAAAALLATLQAHPSLKHLGLPYNTVLPEHAAAAGAALGALIAHSPGQMELDVSHCGLGDAGLGPIMDALPRARQLHTLDCGKNDMSKAFARNRLLPAVRACASLRALDASEGDYYLDSRAVREAQALLRQRRRSAHSSPAPRS